MMNKNKFHFLSAKNSRLTVSELDKKIIVFVLFMLFFITIGLPVLFALMEYGSDIFENPSPKIFFFILSFLNSACGTIYCIITIHQCLNWINIKEKD